MTNPSVDIIVPVWNNLFETRACLASLLAYSPEARLIIIDNGSSRETELMLEEFSEPLGDQALFITTERNIGLVPAINRGLASSDADFVVIVRPQVIVDRDWLKPLLDAAKATNIGIVSPTFRGSAAATIARPASGYVTTETFSLSFASLLLRGKMQVQLGGFDEGLDGGEWCLRDYIRRAEASGYHTCVTMQPELVCGQDTVFGSHERRQEQTRISRDIYLSRWGVARHYCLYFGPKEQADDLTAVVDGIVNGARRGDRFSLLLHRSQFKEFRKRGWNGLHTGVTVTRLPLLGAGRTLARQLAALQASDPDVIAVRGTERVEFPGVTSPLCLSDIMPFLSGNSHTPELWKNVMEVV